MTNSIIELKDLCKTFYAGFRRKRVDAVRGVSLCVEPGEIFGLIGPNGAGKTTTIKMLTGLIRPTSGTMKLMGYEGFDRRCSQRLGYLPEVSYYYESLTAFEILDFYAKLYGIKDDRAKTVDYWLERVNMTHARNKRLGQFSKGMQQRIGLAQALIGDPELVILDEPQSGLDPIGRRDVADIIRECQNKGKTIFFSSHILPDVERLCDRVGVIRNGQMEVVGTLNELLSKDKHIEIVLRGQAEAEFIARLESDKAVKVVKNADSYSITLGPKAASGLNDLLSEAIRQGLVIEHVMERGADLEALFIKD
ncbi:MAG: ABC transporter ATP-binding protein [Proteobacteria bacterium]|nr:ABC transporter ATP-binding protein [Pseudomonadota bacterium]MBQ4359601.1 ABC transporter ATP-binding protein [Pseudomonadota bacterium]